MNGSVQNPLISAADLLAAIDDPSLRIADVRYFLGEPERNLPAYEAGHIPGAVYVDIDKDLAAPPGAGAKPLPDPATFAARMGELGFGDEHMIVIHDAANGQFGARLWVMLDRLGHKNVHMLDGGITAWKQIDGPWTTEKSTLAPATMTLASEWPNTVDRTQVVELQGKVDLVDIRPPQTYSGEDAAADAVGGHIPGARNRPCGSMMTEDGCMKRAHEVLPLIRGEGDRAQLPLVISCQSGVTACFGALAARVAGLPDPLIYVGSFSDWIGQKMPVAQGSEPDGPIAA
jgi:thiosulfate/3-mercaptopyruvate sulfurtransferase